MTDVPEMDATTRAAFERSVARLFNARWHTGKIADWAVSTASGYGRFWRSHEHALKTVNAQCRAINRENRRVYDDARRAAMAAMPPKISEMFKRKEVN